MRLTLEDMRARIRDRRVVILDVLGRDGYAGGHLPRAINIPLGELPQRAADELPDRSRPIAVYCGGPT
ncbi:MAG TPA: rhodanese-like domain-containing protein [Vicinamibacterales bacterium]|jgi:rhodanese-related sulfurtransferase|nr:rhodanese-like domain-containing protein [Vicinamibacterales bacterium]